MPMECYGVESKMSACNVMQDKIRSQCSKYGVVRRAMLAGRMPTAAFALNVDMIFRLIEKALTDSANGKGGDA